MLSAQEELAKLRPELRYLRVRVAQLDRARLVQKQKADRLEELLRERDKFIKELERERDELSKLIDELKKQRDKYKGMLFKPNVKGNLQNLKTAKGKKKKLGGQLGHKGGGRKLPTKVDQINRVFFHHCPNCGNPLKRTDSMDIHTVEDIPAPKQLQTQVTQYQMERQWCGHCGKEVVATPAQVIPHSRLGLNLIIQVLIWKYACRISFEIIVETLFQTYGVEITKGGIINILKRTKKWLGPEYGKLLDIIRGSPIKHADETAWRIKGLNGWLWAFLTRKAVYYTIEHSRGKGVAEKILSASSKDDVLIRDDYAGYKNLKMNHQSCWRHLLGESKEASGQIGASKEVKSLHRKLKGIYQELAKITQLPFNLAQRQTYHQIFAAKLQEIIQYKFDFEDTRKIQTRIRNQGNNLITAILFEGVELTNNLAERGIRKAVVVRKISGGSRSDEGAETFAVNMSIIQTIRMRNQLLIPTLHNLLLKGALGNTI